MGMIVESRESKNEKSFYSAEFKLNHPQIFYRFKIRKSLTEPLYAVVKEGSRVLDNIKEGDVISMQYYSLDKTIPPAMLDTKIKYIAKDSSSGFRNHYVIGLDIEGKDALSVA